VQGAEAEFVHILIRIPTFTLAAKLIGELATLTTMLPMRGVCTRALWRGSIRCASTSTAPTVTRTSSSAAQSVIPLANVEAHWERLTQEEQLTVHKQLEELQKKDWKLLSLDEKKAGEDPASPSWPCYNSSISLLHRVRPPRPSSTYQATRLQREDRVRHPHRHCCCRRCVCHDSVIW
jgi:hypothetical protein